MISDYEQLKLNQREAEGQKADKTNLKEDF